MVKSDNVKSGIRLEHLVSPGIIPRHQVDNHFSLMPLENPSMSTSSPLRRPLTYYRSWNIGKLRS